MTPALSTPAWIAKTSGALGAASRRELEQFLAEAEERLQAPDLQAHTRALLYLLSARARQRLVKAFQGDRVEHLKKSHVELVSALKLAPNQKDVVVAYGTAIADLTAMNGFDRMLVQNLLKLDLVTEARWTYEFLGPHGRDPQVAAALGRLRDFLRLDG